MTTTLDPAARWSLRGDDASVVFHGRAHRFAPSVRARFSRVSGTLAEQVVDVDVDVRSLTTGTAAYDALLATADPFDAGRHPVATYRSTQVRWSGDAAVVDGVLVLRGRPAAVRLLARRRDVDDGCVHLSATGRVDRRAFGLRLELPGCAALVPAQLDLAIEVTAVPVDGPFPQSAHG